MVKKKELTVEEKLRMLYQLQLIDSKIDEIRNLRGSLPLEVEDLQDEIAGLNTRKVSFEEELNHLKQETLEQKAVIEKAQELAKRYNEQIKEIKNSKQYDALNKEIEYQDLEIQLAKKKMDGAERKTEKLTESLEELTQKIAKSEEHLSHKESELSTIIAETEKDEAILIEKSEDTKKKIDERLTKAYDRIRNSVKNKLAVVPIERGAAGGSFFTIPSQIQMDVATRRRVVVDEHSGRILVDPELAAEEQKKMTKILK